MTLILKMKLTTCVLLIACVFTTSVTLISCTGDPEHEVCIPVPKDTTGLGKKEHFIPVDSVNDFRKDFELYRDTLANRVPELYFALSEAFNKEHLLRMLKDPRNIGIRIYYGVKKGNGKVKDEFRLVLVGVDEQGNDLFITRPRKGSAAAQVSGDTELGGLEYGQCNPPCNGPN